MLELYNGHKLEFIAASGALNFYGEGYFWEYPLILLRLLRPEEFTIITKTLTLAPLKGKFRWYKPWKTIKKTRNGWFNNYGMKNPGLQSWINNYKGNKLIVSITPFNLYETELMINMLNKIKTIIGVELNLSCPNINEFNTEQIIEITKKAVKYSEHPIILKLGYQQEYLKICKETNPSAFDLINSISTGEFALSGKAISNFSRQVLKEVNTKIPIISGGGIYSYEEVLYREKLGAKAFSLGTIFLEKPWLPNKIIKQYRHSHITSI